MWPGWWSTMWSIVGSSLSGTPPHPRWNRPGTFRVFSLQSMMLKLEMIRTTMIWKYLFIDCGTLLLTTSTGALFLVDSLVPKMFHMSCYTPFTFPFVLMADFSDMSGLSQAIFSWRLIPIQPFIPPSKEWSNYLLCPVQCVHPFFWHFLSHYHGGTLYT